MLSLSFDSFAGPPTNIEISPSIWRCGDSCFVSIYKPVSCWISYRNLRYIRSNFRPIVSMNIQYQIRFWLSHLLNIPTMNWGFVCCDDSLFSTQGIGYRNRIRHDQVSVSIWFPFILEVYVPGTTYFEKHSYDMIPGMIWYDMILCDTILYDMLALKIK